MHKLSTLVLVAAVVGCGSSTVTQQSGAAACITASGCGIIVGGISNCTQYVVLVNDPAVAAAAHLSPSQVNCIAAAGSDCAKAKQCLANGMTPATCSGNARSCTGNVWQQCTATAGSGTNMGIQLYDCSSVGEMCVTNNGNTDCGFGTCSGGAATCVTPDGTAGGNLVQSCNNGILQRQDCGRFDSSCNPSGILGAHCRGNGAACSKGPLGDTTLRCDGTVLVSCSDGQESRYDCGKDNLGCFSGVGGNAFGCAAGADCDPRNFSATCVGTKLTFCNKGLVQTADCGAAGFASCSPNGGGSCSN
ncbi:MAG: hypothetical protein ACXVAN_08680 [Polyangia bacterium]